MRGPPKNTVHMYLKNTYINYKFQDCYQIYDLLRQLSYLIIQKNSLIKSFKIAIKFMIYIKSKYKFNDLGWDICTNSHS